MIAHETRSVVTDDGRSNAAEVLEGALDAVEPCGLRLCPVRLSKYSAGVAKFGSKDMYFGFLAIDRHDFFRQNQFAFVRQVRF